ncbi:chemotaxis protein CheB [Methylohalobius crimeensis]|uniref:chemotaxis protein CheB n=1 Tax=Methylohalobius crimeensis TaxID=244365 RepID=UPI0003B61A9F|nr:chemotaxis protein CheB [Methylohalobius crimeensis]
MKKTNAPGSGKRDGGSGFPVVGIGASAGGLEALEELFENMPTDTGMAFVVVTHQHPGHTSLLPELLRKETGMKVIEAADGIILRPNSVYVSPSGIYLAIMNATLHCMEAESAQAPHLPIDYFFRSLADDQKERAICIVLSGTGTDGTLGVKAIKGESGMVMAQQPQSAKYAGMPSSAIATGLVDYVVPPAAMPEQLVAYAKGPYLTNVRVASRFPAIPNEPFQKIIVLLRARTGHDFSAYKCNTIRRRIERRMNVHQIKQPNQYLRYLQENPHEIDLLFKELLITVTHFFRDFEAWEALSSYLDELIQSRPEYYTLRVWVPGCATGEEAYSLAIMLRERMEAAKRYFDVQIFGTDLDAKAIETARAGQYPNGIASDIPTKWLERYFLSEDGFYRIRKEVREMVVFAQQNVIKDPPFTKLDILSCRNLLIYLNSDLQKKLQPMFHYALKPDGLLFLGPSETTGEFSELFEPLDKRWKIYRRKEWTTAMRTLPEILAQPKNQDRGTPVSTMPEPPVKETHLSILIERLLLSRFAPASVVVNECGNILYIHGRTGAYLEPAQGEPRNNLLEMAREGLKIVLSAALRDCARKDMEVIRNAFQVKTNGDYAHANLSVEKIQEPESLRGLLLVTFRPATPPLPEAGKSKRNRKAAGDGDRIKQLERELQYMKESYQTTLEELETSNEELQSTNEELQSTNEELETSQEEMQSLNEELTTVNAELQSKVNELSQANDDMQNLLNSTDIATVFLDNDLNIKRYTEQAKELIKLRPTDVGRPVCELASNLKSGGLIEDCRAVLKTLVYKEAEIESRDGGRYLMRIMPYRTSDNRIDGLVLTFVNIGPLKQGEQVTKKLRFYFESIVNTVRSPLLVLNGELRVVTASKAFYRTFQCTARQTEGKPIYQLGSGQWNIPKLRVLLEEILPKNTQFEDFEVEVEVPKLGRRKFVLNARRLKQAEGVNDLILVALEDRTPGQR